MVERIELGVCPSIKELRLVALSGTVMMQVFLDKRPYAESPTMLKIPPACCERRKGLELP